VVNECIHESLFVERKDNNMIKYLWDKHDEMFNVCDKYCEMLPDLTDGEKFLSATVQLKNSMHDVSYYFEGKPSREALYALIRNIDAAIDSILHINNAVLGVNLNGSEKSFKKCFPNSEIIVKFRDLRSLILAHPLNTFKGKEFKGYLEDVYLTDWFLQREVGKDCEYALCIHKPETDVPCYEGLSHKNDIYPVINEINGAVELLINNTSARLDKRFEELKSIPLKIDKTNINTYMDSLDAEIEIRYPWEISDTQMIDGEGNEYIEHYNSLLSECYVLFNSHYSIQDTEEKYQKLLSYLSSELEKIEFDLQNMSINDDNDYFSLLKHGRFWDNANLDFDVFGKMFYLYESEKTSWTTEFISPNCSSDALWGVRCFRKLMPYIEKYFVVDTTVSDRGLYCQFVLAKYLHNVENVEK